VAGAVAAVLLGSCATPSRQLSPHVVDDPIVMPRQVARLDVLPSETRQVGAGATSAALKLGIRVGLTDRLEWTDLGSLTYAFLDDAPYTGRRRAPLSLAVRAGVEGFSVGSISGLIVIPIVSGQVVRHVCSRWTVGASASYTAAWESNALAPSPDVNLPPFAAYGKSAVLLEAGATRQLTNRIAAAANLFASQQEACIDPLLCAWGVRGVGGSLSLIARPWSWLTLSVAPSAGTRFYRYALVPQRPDGPVVVPPPRTSYVEGSGAVTFYW
jgi:hypothetical protein